MTNPLIEYVLVDNKEGLEMGLAIESQVSLLYLDSKVSFISHRASSLKDLIVYLALKNRYPNTDTDSPSGKSESELNHPILFVINSDHYQVKDSYQLNSLSLDDMKLLLDEFYHHLNIIVVKYDSQTPLDLPLDTIRVTQELSENRMKRVLSWIGLNDDKNSALNSMIDDLSSTLPSKERHFTELLIQEIDYKSLIKLNHPKSFYTEMIYEWGFKSHLLSYDELLYCAACIFEIALKNCGEDFLHLGDTNRLLAFVFNVRDNYRMGNQFHNFRHAVDVLQATFYLMWRLDCIPGPSFELSDDIKARQAERTCILLETILPPVVTLTLLIASLGHDIGHPGLTNKFLVDNEAPIAKYFNDISVLESFHYAEFKSILDRFFPTLFTDITHADCLIKKSILSTDMINHFACIDKIDHFLQLDPKSEEYKTSHAGNWSDARYLLCSLLIKCADISNVSRPLDVSAKWGVSLTNETNEIQILEKTLHSKPQDFSIKFHHSITDLHDITPSDVVAKLPSICKGQCFFINNFVIMFFDKIRLILPELEFLYYQIKDNVLYWESCSSP